METRGGDNPEPPKTVGSTEAASDRKGVSQETEKTARLGRAWKTPATIIIMALACLTFFTFPRQPYAIDDSLSEKAVLNYAHEKGLQFGKDIVFTYGPLGFLTSRYFFPQAVTGRFTADLLLCGIVAAGVSA